MARMTEEQKAARKAEREAKQKADIQAWARKKAEEMPPLTEEQIAKVSRILYGGVVDRAPREPSAYELEQRRKAQEQADALKEAERIAASMLACDVCDLPPVAHRMQQEYSAGVGFHEWVPGRAQRILKGER